jgi:hypothetical protein
MGWVVNATPRPLYLRETNPVPIVYEAGWTPGPVWTGAKNLVSPGFDPRTLQLVAGRYTNCAILAHLVVVVVVTNFKEHNFWEANSWPAGQVFPTFCGAQNIMTVFTVPCYWYLF